MLALTQGGSSGRTRVLSVVVEMAKGNGKLLVRQRRRLAGAEGRRQPGINSIKDLKGKEIAVTLSSGAEIALYTS
jgi:ABC-type nitrate/sulfonate/bicarbonate transport system substrate-binding protein